MQSGNETHPTEDRCQPTRGPARSPQASGRSKALRCPQCGGSRIRKPNWYFLISIAVFMSLWLLVGVYGMLAVPVLSALDHLVESSRFAPSVSRFISSAWMILGLVLLPIAVIWPTVICATACFAFVGRYRCKSCGHRFRSIHAPEQAKAEFRFPTEFCILNGVILFLACMASREMVRLISYRAFSVIAVKAIFAAFPTAFFMALSLPYQTIVHRLFRTRIRHNLLWATHSCCPVSCWAGSHYISFCPTWRLVRFLHMVSWHLFRNRQPTSRSTRGHHRCRDRSS